MTAQHQLSTSAFGDGLDLSNLDTITADELARFRDYYERVKGGSLPAHEFLITHRPDALKRYRLMARELTDLDNEHHPLCHTLSHLHMYTIFAFDFGIRYETRQAWAGGARKTDITDTFALANLFAGPRGLAAVANAASQFLADWQEPDNPDRFPLHWHVDRDVLRSGIDFSSQDMLPGEVDKIRDWYRRRCGEVPEHVDFLARYRPRMLKAYRNRFETVIRDSLPVQAVPYFTIHYLVSTRSPSGLKAAVLLARGLGLKKSEVLDAVIWGVVYGGTLAMDMAAEILTPVLDKY
jgi:hypothetical protein